MDQDLELMLRVRRSDEESFEVLLSRHRRSLVSLLARMVPAPVQAEDLSQEKRPRDLSPDERAGFLTSPVVGRRLRPEEQSLLRGLRKLLPEVSEVPRGPE
jgi:hypothetical protein